MNIVQAKWLDLGPYKILQQPLPGNHFWPTHWIYRAGKLIGKLLSVPSLADCQWMERQANAQPLRWAENGDDKKARLRGVAKTTRKRKAA